MALVRGVGASFKLGAAGSPATLTDVSGWLDSIQGSSATGEYDGTRFQPGVANPLKTTVPGFSDKGYQLSGKWDADVEDFFSPLEGVQDVSYEFGPDGTTTGKPKISGTCNVMSYSGPLAPADGLVTFTVTLKVNSRSVGTFTA